jgi:hypothetical protein
VSVLPKGQSQERQLQEPDVTKDLTSVTALGWGGRPLLSPIYSIRVNKVPDWIEILVILVCHRG